MMFGYAILRANGAKLSSQSLSSIETSSQSLLQISIRSFFLVAKTAVRKRSKSLIKYFFNMTCVMGEGGLQIRHNASRGK